MTTAHNPRDRLIPWYFVAFFIGLALVDGGMVTLAIQTQTGMVTDHPYEKGLAYNTVVQAATAQEALGWKGKIAFAETGKNKGIITFTAQDAAGKPLSFEKTTAVISRPTSAGMDFTVLLQGNKIETTFPLAGLWEVRIYALNGHQTYQQSTRIIVK